MLGSRRIEQVSIQNIRYKCAKRLMPRSPIYLSSFHRERLIEAAQFFDWQDALRAPMLSSEHQWECELSDAVQVYLRGRPALERTLKIRLDVFRDGQAKTTFAPVPAATSAMLYPKHLPALEEVDQSSTYDVVLDWVPTQITPFTHLKTANRSDYDEARSRMTEVQSKVYGEAKAIPPSEVILHNPYGDVTEGSFTNVYFWRNNQWITPPVGHESGGLAGVARRWALETKLCERIEKVKVEDVQEGEVVWISNGVRGFDIGRIVYR